MKKNRHGVQNLQVACIQINAGTDWQLNLAKALRFVHEARRRHAELIALPEMFCWRGHSRDMAMVARQATPVIIREFSCFARAHGVWLLLGSVLEPLRSKKKLANTSCLVSPEGKITAKYRKMHLFDVSLPDVRVRESRTIFRGKRMCRARVGRVRCGLSICYDIRFPELYRRLALAGARLFFIPANFTYRTGCAHWEVLVRARAIENQCFVMAPAQTGLHPAKRIRSFGTSLIVDPWGRILAKASVNHEEIITAHLDFQKQDRLRRSFPVLSHASFKV